MTFHSTISKMMIALPAIADAGMPKNHAQVDQPGREECGAAHRNRQNYRGHRVVAELDSLRGSSAAR